MKIDFSLKVVIITGAGGGIGSGMARVFAQNGAVVVVNDVNVANGEKVAKELRTAGGRASFIRADVSNKAEAQAMLDQTVAQFGQVDVLINNAGINIAMKDRGPIHEFPDEAWEKILKVDLDGVYYCSKAALKYMVPAKYGKIINIASIAGSVPLRNQCAFVAAKGGVIQLTRAMAVELAPHNINVNVILPGSTMVPGMVESGLYADANFKSIMSHIPMGRPGTPQDMAYGALYLASDFAGYVTGAELVIDGGWTCGFTRDW
jgi:3-oxoacyl-[acyl-carrier protein] reductase